MSINKKIEKSPNEKQISLSPLGFKKALESLLKIVLEEEKKKITEEKILAMKARLFDI